MGLEVSICMSAEEIVSTSPSNLTVPLSVLILTASTPSRLASVTNPLSPPELKNSATSTTPLAVTQHYKPLCCS